jgi:serine/threonine protein kinase
LTHKLSDKSDVYSFGVVLFELLTSKVPISHGRYIVREMKMAYAEEGMEGLEPILDPCVHEASPQDLQRFLDLAFVCTEDKGDDRPSMNEAVKTLEGLAQHNKAKAKVSALATDETWMDDVYGDDSGAYSYDHGTGGGGNPSFLYSGGFSPQIPQAK